MRVTINLGNQETVLFFFFFHKQLDFHAIVFVRRTGPDLATGLSQSTHDMLQSR
jgi:hypothetical protein